MTDPFAALYDFAYRAGYWFGRHLADTLLDRFFWGLVAGVIVGLVVLHLTGAIQICAWGGCS